MTHAPLPCKDHISYVWLADVFTEFFGACCIMFKYEGCPENIQPF